MPSNHTPPLTLPYGVGTRAHWSRAPEPDLLLLVHGFRGSAVGTWTGLVQQLLSHETAKAFDIVSFGYDSVTQAAGESANDLHTFMDALLRNSKEQNASIRRYDTTVKRNASFRYRRALLVGHSLGACVVRRAVLNQLISGKSAWSTDLTMAWFAPAHRGARIIRLMASVALGFEAGVQLGAFNVASYFAPSLADLREGSTFLKDLLTDTETHAKTHRALKAPLTLWARKDQVVVNGQFASDATPFTVVPGVNHSNICRPSALDVRVTELTKLMK